MTVESDYGLSQSVLGGGRELCVYNMVNNEEQLTIADGKNTEGSNLDMWNTNRPIPTLFDTFKVYDKFYSSELNTISKKVNLFSLNVYLNITVKFLDEADFPLLTEVKLKPNDTADSIDSNLGGVYLITEKILYIDKKVMNQRIRLNKDSYE